MRTDREQLQLAIVLFMVAIAVAGFAFAWWVHLTEQAMEVTYTVEEARGEIVNPSADYPSVAAATAPPTRGAKVVAFEGPDPMVEDTYLREDLPLDYETQMKLYGACLEMGVDYDLALAVMEQETRFQNIMGDGGDSYGYMQVQIKWHKDRMAELGVTDLMDPEGNFRVACNFLRECIDKYGLERGLGYYNSGKAKVTSYSREVMEKYYG